MTVQTILVAPYLYPFDTKLALKDTPVKRRRPLGFRARAVIEHLETNPRSTSRAIAESLGWNIELTRATIKRLLTFHHVTLTEDRTPTRNGPRRFFSLPIH